MDFVNVIIRLLHILSAIGLLGGTIFVVFALVPTLSHIEPELRVAIFSRAKKRFYRVAHPAIILLIVTGAYSWGQNARAYEAYTDQNGPMLQALLGLKVLLAVIVTVLVFADTFKMLPPPATSWPKINLVLGLVIVLLASIIRMMHMQVLTLSQ